MSGVIAVPSGGSSSQVDGQNLSQIRINLNIEYEDCRFEINDQGRYVIHTEGNANLLTTAVCEYSQYLPPLLAAGGTVMAVCYGLYKLGYSAGNFSPGSLEFGLKVEPAKLATIRREITKGRFVESLQDEVDDIINEHQSTLAHLNNFTIPSAKEVQEPSSNPSGNSDPKVGRGGLSSNASPRDVQDTGNGGSASSARDVGEDTPATPAATKSDAVPVTNQPDENKTSKPFQYLPPLLAAGGTVMAVCYGLYKLRYSAGNFSPGSLECESRTSKVGNMPSRNNQGDIRRIAPRPEVQEPSSNPRENSDPKVGRGGLSSDALPDDAKDAGNGGSAPSTRNVGDDKPASTPSDADPVMQPNENKTCKLKPFQYHVGIFAYEHDKEKADRIKGHCDSLGYNSCIFDDWVGAGGEPLPRKVLSFIKECLVLFWIASYQQPVGSYMDYCKIVAHDISIKSKKSQFVFVIPIECSQHPKEKIIPPELIAYDPVKEDSKISARIKATVEGLQASTSNPPAANDSRNNSTTSGPPYDVPGPSITNIIHIHGSNVGNLVLQTQRESEVKPKEE